MMKSHVWVLSQDDVGFAFQVEMAMTSKWNYPANTYSFRQARSTQRLLTHLLVKACIEATN
jgi:hypothetical protein